MRFKIKYKLFFGITFTMIIVMLLVTILMQWSFERGFLNYVNNIEVGYLNTISYKLRQIYEEQQDWQSIRENQKLWQQLINPIPKNQALPEKQFLLPYEPLDIARRMRLFDKNKQLIIGESFLEKELNIRPIIINGIIVGYLGIEPLKNIKKQIDLNFVQQQLQSIYLIAFIGVIVSAVVALLIAFQITKPIHRLLKSAQILTSGNDEQNIEAKDNDELALLAQSFNTLAQTLEENRLQQRQWIADISHELRTPLAVLHGEIQAIADGVRRFDFDTLLSLSSEVDRLNQLIEDLYQLSLSDIGSLSYHKKPLDIVEILNETTHIFNDRLQKKQLQINTYFPQKIILNADKKRLQQLFTNLLENSVRYTLENGQIWIHCQLELQEIIIHFEDSKPSVPDTDMEQIFERLYRVEHSRSRNYGGCGLGLAICKSIVEAHEGTIRAKHSSLGGLHIEIKLPRKDF